MDTGLHAHLACLWEVSARKVGNVHRRRDFADLRFIDFLHSAAAIVPAMTQACHRPVGETVLDAIRATRLLVSTNTNLGIVLLLAPLAAVPPKEPLVVGLEHLLKNLTIDDSRHVFAAIRLARPGGLGEVSNQDVYEEPTLPLREIMALAADRDLIARQYVDGFHEILNEGLPYLRDCLKAGRGLEETIILTHLFFLAQHPDSLIARKRGLEEALDANRRAQVVLARDDAGRPTALAELDDWLCGTADHSRNPGTSADLVTACLFAALREGIISLPLEIPWHGSLE